MQKQKEKEKDITITTTAISFTNEEQQPRLQPSDWYKLFFVFSLLSLFFALLFFLFCGTFKPWLNLPCL